MRNDAENSMFDIILAESMDRLSRNLSHTAALHDELSFSNIRLFTKAQGEITKMHTAIFGLVSEQFINDLREKVRRGQKGVVLEGKTAGGVGYGYDVGEPGERLVNEYEAIVVNRIFSDYASGVSPRAIAKKLNDQGIAGPSGREWKDTTIRGQRDRSTGVLNNAAYIGQLIYGRVEYRKNPKTGKRVSRPQPKENWLVTDVPQLRIIDDALWEAVKTRQEENSLIMPRDQDGNALNRLHRKKHVLSGLLRCGECGGPLAITARDRYGCSAYRASRTCSNKRTIVRDEVETRVLAGLKTRLMEPEILETYLKIVEDDFRKASQCRVNEHKRISKRLSVINRNLDRLVDTIMEGTASSTVGGRLTALEAEKAELERKLTETPEEPVVIPMKDIGTLYAKRVRTLVAGLDDPSLKSQAIEIIQSMIDHIIVTPLIDGFAIDLHGELGGILEIVSDKKKLPNTYCDGSSLSVVAGVGFEPTTFRL